MTNTIKQTKIILIGVCSLLFIYIAYKAYHMSITLDEGHTFKIFQGNEIVKATANNHFLNTLLMQISIHFFGEGELALRLPNVLSFILYCWGCYRFLRNRNIAITLVGIALLLLNPYLIDFFSVARGYGLALGFFLPAFSYLVDATESDELNQFYKNASYCLLLLIFACLANLTYVNINLIAGFILILQLFRFRVTLPGSKNVRWLAIISTLLNIGTVTLLVKELFRLKNVNELYHGVNRGFIHSTLHELVQNSTFYYLNNISTATIWTLCWIVICIFTLIILYTVFHRKYDKLSVSILFLSMFVAAPIIQFYLLDTHLPFGRTSLTYIPLFGVTIVFFLKSLMDKQSRKKNQFIKIASIIFFFVPSAYNFAINANSSYVFDWEYNRSTKRAIMKVAELSKDRKTTIVYNIFEEPGVRYYLHRFDLDRIQMAGDNKQNVDEEYLFVNKKESERFKNMNEYQLIEEYIAGELSLYARTHPNQDKNEIKRMEVNIQSENGNFLNRNYDFHIYANQSRPNYSESFSFVKYENEECAIKSFDGYYVCANFDTAVDLTADRPKRGDWELFHYTNLGNGFYAFKAYNNRYLSLDTDGRIYPRANSIGNSERFKIIEIKHK